MASSRGYTEDLKNTRDVSFLRINCVLVGSVPPFYVAGKQKEQVSSLESSWFGLDTQLSSNNSPGSPRALFTQLCTPLYL